MMQKKSNYTTAFIAIVFTFFFWGFVASSNGVLIPLFKNSFSLSQFQSQFVDSAFYLAYFVGSLVYFFVSLLFGDPINKIGYKNGLRIGLLISACGAAIFIPAAKMVSYPLFLVALFTIGLGFALMQIVANPFVINLGNPNKGAARLNFAGGINSLGTTLGPVILAYVLFGKANAVQSNTITLENVKTPYVILAVLLVLLAVIISVVKMPQIGEQQQGQNEILDNTVFPTSNRKNVFQYPQLVLGMIAIFVYVGTEVTIPSNMAALLKLPSIKGIDTNLSAKYISLYWGSLMIGRMCGSLSTFKLSKVMYNLLSVIVPFAVFGIVLYFNYLRQEDITDLYKYAVWIVLFIIIKFIGEEKPSKTLVLFGIAAMVFMLIGLTIPTEKTWLIFSNGVILNSSDIALFSFLSGGLFCSVMWPNIFNLAIAGLGKHTNQASSLLIMMILGGALIPPLQGKLVDISIGIHQSYWVPFVGFAYLAWYGFACRKILQKQGIDYDIKNGIEN